MEKVFSTVYFACNTIKPFLPDDENIQTAYESLMLYIDGISTMAIILDPEFAKHNDDFCRGVQFGVKGTNVIVKISKVLREAQYAKTIEGRIAKTKKNQAKKESG